MKLTCAVCDLPDCPAGPGISSTGSSPHWPGGGNRLSPSPSESNSSSSPSSSSEPLPGPEPGFPPGPLTQSGGPPPGLPPGPRAHSGGPASGGGPLPRPGPPMLSPGPAWPGGPFLASDCPCAWPLSPNTIPAASTEYFIFTLIFLPASVSLLKYAQKAHH